MKSLAILAANSLAIVIVLLLVMGIKQGYPQESPKDDFTSCNYPWNMEQVSNSVRNYFAVHLQDKSASYKVESFPWDLDSFVLDSPTLAKVDRDLWTKTCQVEVFARRDRALFEKVLDDLALSLFFHGYYGESEVNWETIKYVGTAQYTMIEDEDPDYYILYHEWAKLVMGNRVHTMETRY